MKKLKLHERFRLFIQCISFCFHNGYVRGWMHGKISSGDNKAICVPGLNCYSCPGAVGACPLGSLQAILDGGQYHISLYVFGFIAGVGVFCGRFVCGWLCPFGLIQDLLHKIPLFKKVKNMPGHDKLRYLRFVILALFVIILPSTVRNAAGSGEPWFCEWICPSGTLLGGIPLLIANPALRSAAGIRFAWKCLILLTVIILSIKYYRPFCKYVCPLGALYGIANPISIYRLRCDESACVKCGACQSACGMDIKVWEKPNSMDCIRCGKCLSACPTGALSTTFTKKKTEPVDTDKKISVEDVESAEKAENVSGKKISIGLIILGIVIAVLGVIALVASLFSPALFAAQASVPGDLSSIIFTYVQFIVWTVPSVLLILFGFKLIRYSNKTEILDKLRQWPVKLLAVWAGSLLVVYFSYMFSFLLDGEISVSDIWNNFGLMLSNNAVGILVTLIATLLTFLCGRKKEDTFIENHKLLKHPVAEAFLWSVLPAVLSIVVGSTISTIVTQTSGLDENIVQYTVLIITGIIFYMYFIKRYRPCYKGDALLVNCKEKDIITIILLFLAVDIVLFVIDAVQADGVAPFSFVTIYGAAEPAFLEEVMYRMLPIAAAMYIFKDRGSIVIPIAVSSVFFGLIHFINLLSGAAFGATTVQVISACITGVFFGALYIRTGTILPGIAIHFLHDFMCNIVFGIGVATRSVTAWEIAETIIIAVLQLVLSYMLLKGKTERIKSVWNDIWVAEK